MRFLKETGVVILVLSAICMNAFGAEMVGFTGLKYKSKNILYSPWLGTQEAKDILSTGGTEIRLEKIPGSSMSVGKNVWIYNLDNKSTQNNQIADIRIVKGTYGFDGGDVALEVQLEENLSSSGKQVLMDKPLPDQTWKVVKVKVGKIKDEIFFDLLAKGYRVDEIDTKKEGPFLFFTLGELPEKYWRDSSPAVHILFSKSTGTWKKIYEDKKWSLEPSADMNGDGFPEFYAPFPDSADGNLISIYSKDKPFNIEFSTGR
jgi:hypothetical protein